MLSLNKTIDTFLWNQCNKIRTKKNGIIKINGLNKIVKRVLTISDNSIGQVTNNEFNIILTIANRLLSLKLNNCFLVKISLLWYFIFSIIYMLFNLTLVNTSLNNEYQVKYLNNQDTRFWINLFNAIRLIKDLENNVIFFPSVVQVVLSQLEQLEKTSLLPYQVLIIHEIKKKLLELLDNSFNNQTIYVTNYWDYLIQDLPDVILTKNRRSLLYLFFSKFSIFRRFFFTIKYPIFIGILNFIAYSNLIIGLLHFFFKQTAN